MMASILCPYEVVLLFFYSSSVSFVFQLFFSNFIFLFRDGVCAGSSVLGSSSGGLVALSAGTASSLSNPSVLPTSVTISRLVPSSPCVFACRVRAVCLVGQSSNAAISASTVITSWRSVQVVKSTGFASSSWGFRTCLRC